MGDHSRVSGVGSTRLTIRPTVVRGIWKSQEIIVLVECIKQKCLNVMPSLIFDLSASALILVVGRTTASSSYCSERVVLGSDIIKESVDI